MPTPDRAAASRPRYRTIVADPPWRYEQFIPSHTPTTGASWRRPHPYSMMTLDEIKALPVAEWAQDDCRLFCWATSRYLLDAVAVVRAWDFRYRQTLVWRKTGNPTPLPATVAPNHAEFLLVCERGKPRRIGTWPTSVIDAPKGAHSAKRRCSWTSWSPCRQGRIWRCLAVVRGSDGRRGATRPSAGRRRWSYE